MLHLCFDKTLFAMKKLLILLATLVGAATLSAQNYTEMATITGAMASSNEVKTTSLTPEVSRAVVLRASGNFSMVNIHFAEFPNRFQLGGGATLSAAYEHPISSRTLIGAGAGASIEKVTALDKTYYYRNLTMSSVYAEVYYNFVARNGLFVNLGIQGGYAPPILSLTAAPDYEGGLKLRRLSPYQSKAGNVWFLGRIGRNFGKWEVALSLRYTLLSPFGEAFPYPMLTTEQESAYRDVRSRHLAAGVSFGYRLEW